MTGTELATVWKQVEVYKNVPAEFFQVVNAPLWVESVLTGREYEEPDPDFIMRMLAAETIFAATPEEALEKAEVLKLQEWLPDAPGASTGPISIHGLYVAKTDFKTGQPAFVIANYTHLGSSATGKFSTGATNVQATIIGLMRHDVWPIRCQLKRGDSKDKGGHYLIFMLPAD